MRLQGQKYETRLLQKLAISFLSLIAIIGDASRRPRSQSETRRILRTLRGSGLQEQTRLLGYQPHARLVEEAYPHHIYVSPSVTASDGDTEGGGPKAIIEMLASGMPVVSTHHCDIPEHFPPEQAHRLANERDVEGSCGRSRL